MEEKRDDQPISAKVEAYLSGELEGKELEDFELQLQNDHAL